MKKHLSLFLAALMVLASFAVTGVSAAPADVSDDASAGTVAYIPMAEPQDPADEDLTVLDENQVDGQGIFYTLDHENKTAIVGKNTYSDSASAGFTGNPDDSADTTYSIIIPSIVTFNSEAYNVVAVGRNAFDGVRNIGEVIISAGVSSIGEFAFAGSSVERVCIASAIEIDGFAFWGCDKLTDLDLGEFLKSIGGGAFWKCSKLYVVTAPATVENVMAKAFADSGLGQIYFLGANAPAIGAEAIPSNALIMASASAIDGFAAAGYTATEYSNAQIVTSTVFGEAGGSVIVPISLAGFKGGELDLTTLNLEIADGLASKAIVYAADGGIIDPESVEVNEETGAISFKLTRNANGTILLAEIAISEDAAPGQYQIKATAPGTFNTGVGAVIVCDHADMDTAVTVRPATCTEAGVADVICSYCGKLLRTEETEATSHNYEDFVVNPTCTEKGYTRHICLNCGDKYTDAVTDANGHDFDGGVASVAPTLNKEGLVIYTCRTCSYNERKTVGYGDIDCDGKISVSDAILVLKAVANWDLSDTAYHADLADLNSDGKVSVGDAILVLKLVAGWDLSAE